MDEEIRDAVTHITEAIVKGIKILRTYENGDNNVKGPDFVDDGILSLKGKIADLRGIRTTLEDLLD